MQQAASSLKSFLKNSYVFKAVLMWGILLIKKTFQDYQWRHPCNFQRNLIFKAGLLFIFFLYYFIRWRDEERTLSLFPWFYEFYGS